MATTLVRAGIEANSGWFNKKAPSSVFTWSIISCLLELFDAKCWRQQSGNFSTKNSTFISCKKAQTAADLLCVEANCQSGVRKTYQIFQFELVSVWNWEKFCQFIEGKRVTAELNLKQVYAWSIIIIKFQLHLDWTSLLAVKPFRSCDVLWISSLLIADVEVVQQSAHD